MAKKLTPEAAIARLRAEFAHFEESVQELVASIEADERDSYDSLREEMGELYQQGKQLAERFEALKERASSVADRAEKVHDDLSVFFDEVDTLVTGVNDAVEQHMDPSQWQWDDE